MSPTRTLTMWLIDVPVGCEKLRATCRNGQPPVAHDENTDISIELGPPPALPRGTRHAQPPPGRPARSLPGGGSWMPSSMWCGLGVSGGSCRRTSCFDRRCTGTSRDGMTTARPSAFTTPYAARSTEPTAAASTRVRGRSARRPSVPPVFIEPYGEDFWLKPGAVFTVVPGGGTSDPPVHGDCHHELPGRVDLRGRRPRQGCRRLRDHREQRDRGGVRPPAVL